MSFLPSGQLLGLIPVWVFHQASFKEAALVYAGVGLPVFPLQPRGKAPLVARGLYAATTLPQVIEAWWQRWPDANIGMPLGEPSGCWALDVDPRHGGDSSLEQLSPLPPTRVQQTGGGGIHLLYQARTDLPVRLSNAVGFAGFPGLDLKVGGGYIVVAPSVHVSGQRYAWQTAFPISPFPTALVERWCAHRQRASCSPHPDPIRSFYEDEACNGEREADPAYWLRCALKYGGSYGHRHTYAVFLACRLMERVGLRFQEAIPYVMAYAQQVPQDGADVPACERWSVAEALRCLEWAATRRTTQDITCRVR